MLIATFWYVIRLQVNPITLSSALLSDYRIDRTLCSMNLNLHTPETYVTTCIDQELRAILGKYESYEKHVGGINRPVKMFQRDGSEEVGNFSGS